MTKKISLDTLFCLCFTALCISLPLNGLSPSLSLVAHELHLSPHQRDLYLGAYIYLATMIGQLIGSCIAGFLTDRFSRKHMVLLCLVAASVAMILFGMVLHYPTMLAMRVVSGGCQGLIVPVIFSLIGDYCSTSNRATTAAIVSSCLGGGMMIGQLFTGYCLYFLGWRWPFVAMGGATLLVLVAVYFTLKEPIRGAGEEDLSAALSSGVALPTMTTSTYLRSIMVPTTAIMLLQTIPNTVPWGVLSAHFHDLLATDSNLSMERATSLIGLFGVGAAIGGLFGGMLGSKVYTVNRRMLPVLMGVTMAFAAVLLKELLSIRFDNEADVQLALPVLLLAGALAAVNGANIRVVVLNVTSPEARGAAIATLNIVNNLGRGFGPMLAEWYMHRTKMGRREAVGWFLNLWLVSGSILLLASATFAADEDRLKAELRRFSTMGTHVTPKDSEGVSV